MKSTSLKVAEVGHSCFRWWEIKIYVTHVFLPWVFCFIKIIHMIQCCIDYQYYLNISSNKNNIHKQHICYSNSIYDWPCSPIRVNVYRLCLRCNFLIMLAFSFACNWLKNSEVVLRQTVCSTSSLSLRLVLSFTEQTLFVLQKFGGKPVIFNYVI